MTKVVLHYFRYLPATCTFSKAGGGTVVLPAGWYNLTSVLALLRSGSVTCSWDDTTNRTAFSPNITCDTVMIQYMLGIASGSVAAGTSAPVYTWIPERANYTQALCPIGVAGKKKYDTDFYTTQSGKTYALGSVDVYSETFTFTLVKKDDVFTITGDAGLSSPLVDAVYRPDLCIVFELKQGDSVSNSAGYVAGSNWCHTGEPEVAMQMPPWDLYYTVKFEANKYVV